MGIGGDGPRAPHRGTRGILPIAPKAVTIDPGEMTGLTTVSEETTGRGETIRIRGLEEHHPLTTPTRPHDHMGMALDRDMDLVPGVWVNRPHGRISGMECRPSLPEDRPAAAAEEEAGTAQWISRGGYGASLRKVIMLIRCRRRQERDNMTLTVWPPSPKEPFRDDEWVLKAH